MARKIEVQLVERLLWATIALIVTGMLLTLSAQPSSFWNFPQTAIRFDGLPIHSSTNPMFDFFLGRGWTAYTAGVALYGALVWLVVVLLPTRLAMVMEFTIILGLGYTGSNWIAVRWHTGTGGATVYAAAVAITLTTALLPFTGHGDRRALRRLRWVMALTIAIDGIFTLIGQPESYWQNPTTVHEANPLSKFFLERGWWAFAAYILVQIAVPWLFVMRIPRSTGWAAAFGMTLGGFFGGSNWLFYEWRLGLQAPVVYGVLLSFMIAWSLLKRNHAATPGEHAVKCFAEYCSGKC